MVKGGEEVAVKAVRETVLCAGAIGTPQILELSGIGQGSLLQQHGIEVKLDKPGVGANLQDHLQIRAVFKVQGVKTLNMLANSLWGKAQIGMEYVFKRSGPMSMAPSRPSLPIVAVAILVAVDLFSRFCWIVPIPAKTAAAVGR